MTRQNTVSKTPTIEWLREADKWNPSWDELYDWDPDWAEQYLRMCMNPWTSGILPLKTIELICIGLNAACTNLQLAGTSAPRSRRVRPAMRFSWCSRWPLSCQFIRAAWVPPFSWKKRRRREYDRPADRSPLSPLRPVTRCGQLANGIRRGTPCTNWIRCGPIR